MAKLRVITGENNPVLRKKSVEVKKFDATLKKLVKDMKEVLTSLKGLGLAAPQVGMNLRLFVTTLDHGEKGQRLIVMVNPKISVIGDEVCTAEEGCLSLPGIYKDVTRFEKINVEFFDVEGARNVLKLSGLNSRIVQHENDHLNGVLFVDKG